MQTATAPSATNNRIIILGGTFNPVHIGHLRMAIEAKERLCVSRVELVPSFLPPHKSNKNLLPFELRLESLNLAISGLDNFFVSQVEAERPGPSYTWQTLKSYRSLHPNAEIFFLLGLNDFFELSTWYKWQELPKFANLVIIPRGNYQESDFTNQLKEYWPQAKMLLPQCASHLLTAEVYNATGAGKICLLPLPLLSVSSSLIREKWKKGLNIDFILPPKVLTYLEAHKSVLSAHWGKA